MCFAVVFAELSESIGTRIAVGNSAEPAVLVGWFGVFLDGCGRDDGSRSIGSVGTGSRSIVGGGGIVLDGIDFHGFVVGIDVHGIVLGSIREVEIVVDISESLLELMGPVASSGASGVGSWDIGLGGGLSDARSFDRLSFGWARLGGLSGLGGLSLGGLGSLGRHDEGGDGRCSRRSKGSRSSRWEEMKVSEVVVEVWYGCRSRSSV